MEEVYRRDYSDLEEVKSSMCAYIDGFYNMIRIYSTLNNISPQKVADLYYEGLKSLVNKYNGVRKSVSKKLT